jgi:signal transduction histidine kinase
MDTMTQMTGAGKAAVDILDGLLLYDKVEDSVVPAVKVQQVSPLNLIEESMDMFRAPAKEKDIQLIFDRQVGSDSEIMDVSRLIESDMISVDKQKVVQVLRNLLSNAIKFTPVDGRIVVSAYFLRSEQPQIRASSTWQSLSWRLVSKSNRSTVTAHGLDGGSDGGRSRGMEGFLVVEVTDSGVGIDKADQERLFRDIVQFHPEMLQGGGGSGLGMLISAGIAQSHGGEP